MSLRVYSFVYCHVQNVHESTGKWNIFHHAPEVQFQPGWRLLINQKWCPSIIVCFMQRNWDENWSQFLAYEAGDHLRPLANVKNFLEANKGLLFFNKANCIDDCFQFPTYEAGDHSRPLAMLSSFNDQKQGSFVLQGLIVFTILEQCTHQKSCIPWWSNGIMKHLMSEILTGAGFPVHSKHQD